MADTTSGEGQTRAVSFSDAAGQRTELLVSKRLEMSGGRTVMDRITESLLKDFCKERNLDHLEESEQFEHFCSFVMVSRHHAEHFDTADIVTRVDGSGGNDTGVDGIAILLNGMLITDVESVKEEAAAKSYLEVTLIFIQAERSPSFDNATIGTFGFAVSDFFKSAPHLPRNNKVGTAAEIVAEILSYSSKFRVNPVCRLYYVTTGSWQANATPEARRNAAIEDLRSTSLFSNVTLEPIGAETLQKWYRQTRNANSKDFVFENKTTIPEIPGVDQAYLGFLKAQEFIKLLEDDKGDIIGGLFYDNVRDWQGDNDVNMEIVNTLNSDASNQFVLLNNGITIIASILKPTGNRFHIEDYQIVNGCQTSHVLFNNKTQLTEKVIVPVRIIATKDEQIVNAIIRATNRQTEVTEEQFFALQEFPKQLEQYFKSFPADKRLYFERRDMQYGRSEIEKTRIITRGNTIKAFAAMFLNDAHSTTRNYSRITDKVGGEIFGKGHKMDPYYTAAFALYSLEFLFRNKRLEPKYKAARFHILLATRLLANPDQMPAMTANKMEKYCQVILDKIWDQTASEALMAKAVSVIDKAAGGDFHRDNIRTEPFTKKVVELAKSSL